jgi:hypothetical protein
VGLGYKEKRMIDRRQIDHLELVKLGKTLLLLFRRQELLVHIPATTLPTQESMPIGELRNIA